MAEAPTPEVHTPSAPKSGGGILDELKRMPPWAWLIIAGGAFVGYKLFIAGGQSNTPATTDTTGTNPPSGTSGDGGGSSSGGGGSDGGGGSSSGNPPPPASPMPQGGSGDTGDTGQSSSGSTGAPTSGNPPPPASPVREPPQPIGPTRPGHGPTPPPASPVRGRGTPPASPVRQTYTVRQGDTLSGIGQRYGVAWETIYDTNSAVIEQTAEQRSGHGSDHGTWIYPGEVLAIP